MSGEKIGLIGTTGSGKTTLVDAILGLQSPSSGTIEIDEVPLGSVACSSWLNQIGYVPQFIYLKEGSILENIAFGVSGGSIDLDKIKYAAKIAQADHFIQDLEDEYESHVGENGANLSGGQRQRIGIARALYRNPNLLILDEATSALDEETEQKVMEGIYSNFSEITMIVVAHRKSTLSKCDRIIRLDRGQISSL